MRVFICSPYRGDIEKNVENARRYARHAALCGYSPVVPHLTFPQFLRDADPEERIRGIQLGIEQMQMCDEVWIIGGVISKGMAYELQKAKEMGIPVRLYDSDLNRILPETLLIDDRVSDAFRAAIEGHRFV